METTTAPKIVGPKDGGMGFLGSIGVRFMIDGDETPDRGFSLEARRYRSQRAMRLARRHAARPLMASTQCRPRAEAGSPRSARPWRHACGP